MKLVEILARELVEWPKGDFSAVQDINGAVGFCLFPADVRLIDGKWISRNTSEPGTRNERKYELAADHATAIVTREQWQAERRRFERNVTMHHVDHDGLGGVVERAAIEWIGEGLPPLGVECEFKSAGHHSNPDYVWCVFRGAMSDGGYIVEYHHHTAPSRVTVDAFDPATTSFRPIRTPRE